MCLAVKLEVARGSVANDCFHANKLPTKYQRTSFLHAPKLQYIQLPVKINICLDDMSKLTYE